MNKFTVIFWISCSLLLASCSDDPQSAASSSEKNSASSEKKLTKPSSPLDVLDSTPSHTHAEHSSPEKTDAPLVGSDDESVEALEDAEPEYYEPPTDKVSISPEALSGVIKWNAPVDVPYSRAKLTISGQNGDQVVRDFGAGEPIELYGQLPDGLYGWESVIVPEIEPYVKEEMLAARASGDLAAERELQARFEAEGSIPSRSEARENVQSGNFIVRDGVVTPSYADEPNGNEGN